MKRKNNCLNWIGHIRSKSCLLCVGIEGKISMRIVWDLEQKGLRIYSLKELRKYYILYFEMSLDLS